MPTHLGIDEAGLGPILGPICWGGCRWSHPHEEDQQLWRDLRPLVSAPGEKGLLQLGDSKALHRGAHRLAKLELQVLTWVSFWLGGLPAKFGTLWTALGGETSDRCPITGASQPSWLLAAFDQRLPLRASAQSIDLGSQALSQRAAEIGLERIQLRSRVLCAPAFNQDMHRIRAQGGTKNNFAIYHASALARQLWGKRNDVQSIIFDKMGGRKSYKSQLGVLWPDTQLEIEEENAQESRYRLLIDGGLRSLCRFVTKSESRFPSVALAACLAKYMRELVMAAFQDHFQRQYPQIKPTAGYPQDARRFLSELQALDALELREAPQSDWIRRS